MMHFDGVATRRQRGKYCHHVDRADGGEEGGEGDRRSDTGTGTGRSNNQVTPTVANAFAMLRADCERAFLTTPPNMWRIRPKFMWATRTSPDVVS